MQNGSKICRIKACHLLAIQANRIPPKDKILVQSRPNLQDIKKFPPFKHRLLRQLIFGKILLKDVDNSSQNAEKSTSESHTEFMPTTSLLYNLMPIDECIEVFHELVSKLYQCTTVPEQMQVISTMTKLTFEKISKYASIPRNND